MQKTSKYSIIKLFLLILCVGLTLALGHSSEAKKTPHYANARDTIGYTAGETFAVPPGLKHAVNFWIKVYTRYTTKQSVVHDNRHLQVVYASIDFSHLYLNTHISEKKRRKLREEKAEEVKDHYRAILKKLDLVDMEEIPYESLTDEEKRVYHLFDGINEAYRFEKSMRRLRSQVGQKDEFIRGIVDSGSFIREMEDIFRSYRLPTELVRLAFVESMFNTKALSKVYASGIWQFMKSTGRNFLRIDHLVDERNDPILATHAAARLLSKNHDGLDSWPLAINAYNHGRAGMKRAVARTKTKDIVTIINTYKSRTYGFASRNFYAQFLAALYVERNHKRYFGSLAKMDPVKYDTVRLPDHVSLKTISDYCKIPEDEIIDLNPALNKPVINSIAYIPTDYDLRIPLGTKKEFIVLYANIPNEYRHELQHAVQWHRVARGEVLSRIARRHRVSMRQLLKANGLSSANRIYVGQLLKIPKKPRYVAKKKSKKPKDFVKVARATKAEVTYPEVKVIPLEAVETEDKEDNKTSDTFLESESSDTSVAQTTINNDDEENNKTSTSSDKGAGLGTLFSLVDPVNKDKDFNLKSTETTHAPIATESVAWKLDYFPDDKNADKEAPFRGKTIVADGETPGHFAEWCQISTPQFRRHNKIRFGQGISLGQKVKLNCRVSLENLHKERLAFHKDTQAQFMSSCPAVNVINHKIRPNENIWELANKAYNTPIWLIQQYNPDHDLTKALTSGVTIRIPKCSKLAKL